MFFIEDCSNHITPDADETRMFQIYFPRVGDHLFTTRSGAQHDTTRRLGDEDSLPVATIGMFLKSRRAPAVVRGFKVSVLGAARATNLIMRSFWPGVENYVEPTYENQSARARYLISPSPY
jgi:hypothetical protein